MARTTLTLEATEDMCLGHSVYRGSAQAGMLVDASWIDFHDPQQNPLGYQRPFNAGRSQEAATYANTDPDAFWPECIFAVRTPDEDDPDEDVVKVRFAAIAMNFGTLTIEYNNDRHETINGQVVPWKRALSQVDCQHRLGK